MGDSRLKVQLLKEEGVTALQREAGLHAAGGGKVG